MIRNDWENKLTNLLNGSVKRKDLIWGSAKIFNIFISGHNYMPVFHQRDAEYGVLSLVGKWSTSASRNYLFCSFRDHLLYIVIILWCIFVRGYRPCRSDSRDPYLETDEKDKDNGNLSSHSVSPPEPRKFHISASQPEVQPLPRKIWMPCRGGQQTVQPWPWSKGSKEMEDNWPNYISDSER